MDKGYLPREHSYRLVKETVPSMRWGKNEPIGEWQAKARAKLCDLIGLPEIEKFAVKPEIEIEYDRHADNLNCREIRFRMKTEENVTIPCHLCIPDNAAKPLPVVIALQGHSKGMHISLSRPKFPGDEVSCSSGDRDFVRRAVKEGVCAVALEQRCFGENGGDSETSKPDCGQTAMNAILIGRTLIGERVWDVMRMIDILTENFKDVIDTEKILCLGNSGGGTATIYATAIDERIKIGVPSCAISTYAESIVAIHHCLCNYVPNIAKYFDMGDLCALVAPRALIVVSGIADEIFPIESAKECVCVGREAYRAYGIEDHIVHVIGNEGHRFYADPAWPHIHEAIERL